jgi:hypothetical protein
LHTSELFDDLVAAGHLALWQAIKGHNVNVEYRLWTFASKAVTGAISDAAAAFRQHVSGVTRIDRWLFGHWNATPEQLFRASKKLGLKRPLKSVSEAAERIEEFEKRYRRETFDSTTGDIIAQAYKDEDGDGSVKYVHAAHARSYFDVFNPRQLAPHLHVHDRISDIVDDLARGRNVEPKRYRQVDKYFDEEERQKWTAKPKRTSTKEPLPLLRPRRWHGQSKKRRRRSFAVRAQSAAER